MYAKFHRPVTRALAAVPVNEIGHALASQQLRRSRDFEMQMRLASVSGITNPRQYLSAPHAVSRFHAQAAWLQVHVVCELPAAQVERDVSLDARPPTPHAQTQRRDQNQKLCRRLKVQLLLARANCSAFGVAELRGGRISSLRQMVDDFVGTEVNLTGEPVAIVRSGSGDE